jgi:Kef-type K+ transport system membrane component KefB
MLTASAIAPVGFTYAWVAYAQDETFTATLALGVSLIAVVVCLVVLAFARKNLEAMPFTPASIEAADNENIGFMLLYLLPLFTDKINTLNWQLWIPTVAIFAIITATGYSYHFNPLLGLMRWHFYKVSSSEGVTYVLITRKHLRTAASSLSVGQLTEYILIDLKGDK